MIFWRKIVIFHTNYPNNFAPPFALRNYFTCAALPSLKSWIRPCIQDPYSFVFITFKGIRKNISCIYFITPNVLRHFPKYYSRSIREFGVRKSFVKEVK
jgi:hypothetical protein